MVGYRQSGTGTCFLAVLYGDSAKRWRVDNYIAPKLVPGSLRTDMYFYYHSTSTCSSLSSFIISLSFTSTYRTSSSKYPPWYHDLVRRQSQ